MSCNSYSGQTQEQFVNATLSNAIRQTFQRTQIKPTCHRQSSSMFGARVSQLGICPLSVLTSEALAALFQPSTQYPGMLLHVRNT